MQLLFALLTSLSILADDGGMSVSSLPDTSSWTFRYFQIGGTRNQEVKEGGAGYSAYNYFYFKKYFDYDQSVRFAFPFIMTAPGYDGFGEQHKGIKLRREDWFVGYINRNLVLLPGDIGTYSEFRFYLPTSQYAIDEGRIGRLRADFILSKKVSRNWWAQSWLKFNYFIQSNTLVKRTINRNDGTSFQYNDATKESWIEVPLSFYYTFPKVWVGFGSNLRWDKYNRASKHLETAAKISTSSISPNEKNRLSGGEERKISTGPRVAFNVAQQLRMQFNIDQVFRTGSRNPLNVENMDIADDDKYKLTVFIWAGFRDIF